MQTVGKIVLQTFHYAGRAVRRIVVDDQNIESFRQSKNSLYNSFNVFFFVVCGNQYDTVAHLCMVLNSSGMDGSASAKKHCRACPML